MNWNSNPQVESVAGRTIGDLLKSRPRRQRMPGFSDAYCDIVDYIVRLTHRIWEEKDVGLILTHYSADCLVFTLSGRSVGAEEVVQNTLVSLSGHPDRSPIAEEVIWSEDEPGVFLSSHRLMSYGTHLGSDSMVGSATGIRAAVAVMADCVCKENLIVEEWLVRDYVQFARNFGVGSRELAGRLALQDQQGDQSRHLWLQQEIDRVRALGDRFPPEDHPASPISKALDLAFNHDLYGEAARTLSPSIEIFWPAGRHLVGRGAWIGCLLQLRSQLSNLQWLLDHWAARPLPGGDVAVALRWWLVGRHTGRGAWGEPSGRRIVVLAISHYRLRNGRVTEDMTVFDEVGVLRQIAGGLGACLI